MSSSYHHNGGEREQVNYHYATRTSNDNNATHFSNNNNNHKHNMTDDAYSYQSSLMTTRSRSKNPQYHPSSNDSTSSVTTKTSIYSMDEAYRRLGHKLSQRVTSGSHPYPTNNNNQRIINTMGCQETSAFSKLMGVTTHRTVNPTVPSPSQYHQEEWNRNRVHKVPKMGYSDSQKSHSWQPTQSHYPQNSKESCLKQLTCHMKLTYNDIQLSKSSESLQSSSSSSSSQPIVANKKRISPTTPSPNGEMSSNHPIRNKTGKTNNQPRGMLESVLESQSTTTSLADVVASSIPSSQLNPPSSSSSSPVPLPPSSSTITQPPSHKKCLTVPSEPVANHGLDNAEGNLIVFEGDVIQTTKLTILKGNTIVGPQLKVLELLGQGTFAQVFLCECPTTHSRMAVKIVKNKPAYTRQAGIEIEIFQTLADSKISMVQLDCYFIYQNHLCLVFELLGMNLYEVLKGRQFRGLPLTIVKALIRQAVEAIRDLSAKSIVHCDLKPENILLDPSSDTQESFSSILQAADTAVAAAAAATTTPRGHSQQQSLKNLVGTPCTEDSNETNHTTNPGSMSGSSSDSSGQQQVGGLTSQRSPPPEPSIKLIDFGSACFEGHTTHTYIQSRFYRSPEVLVGVPYDSAIDMWSLGCVAAELFLGLPILPGVHEHDQLGRISEMIGSLPDWMLEQGSKSAKYYSKQIPRPVEPPKSQIPPQCTPSPGLESGQANDQGLSATSSSWRIKTQQEYIQSLSASELRKKGGLAKLEKQMTNRYFKRTKLSDIIFFHGKVGNTPDEKDQVAWFVHFLYGVLDPDPWKRWTAFQASQHPFLTGRQPNLRRSIPSATLNHSNSGASTGETTLLLPSSQSALEISWVPPWDPSICRRKLHHVKKTREKQQQQLLLQQQQQQQQQQQVQHRRSSSGRLGLAITSESDVYDANRMSHGNTKYGSISEDYGYAASNSSLSGYDKGSPPPTLGHPLSSGMYLRGDHADVVGSDVIGSQGYMCPPHSLTELSQYSGMPSEVHSSVPLSYVETSSSSHRNNISSYHPTNSLQAYSGYSYEGINLNQMDADFGYALQRPGVIPSTNDFTGSFSSVSSMGYSPHHHPSGLQTISNTSMHLLKNQSGYAGRHSSMPNHRRGSRNSSYNMGHMVPMSPMSQSFNLHHAQATICEDGSNGSFQGDGASSINSGASLLAQQLEAQAAIARENAYQDTKVQYRSTYPNYLEQTSSAYPAVGVVPHYSQQDMGYQHHSTTHFNHHPPRWEQKQQQQQHYRQQQHYHNQAPPSRISTRQQHQNMRYSSQNHNQHFDGGDNGSQNNNMDYFGRGMTM